MNPRSIQDNKIKRITKACDSCRERKKRCDGIIPCSNCIQRKIECTYFFHQEKLNKKNSTISFRFYQPSYKLEQDMPNQVDLKFIGNEANSLVQNSISPLRSSLTIIKNKKKELIRHNSVPQIYKTEFGMAKLNVLFSLLNITNSSMLNKGILYQLYPNSQFQYQGYSPMGCLTAEITFYDRKEEEIRMKKNANKTITLPSKKLSNLEDIEYNAIEETLVLNMLAIKFQRRAIEIYFKRFHSSFPVLSKKCFYNWIEKYGGLDTIIQTKIQAEFRFLLEIVLLISCSHSDFPKRLYLYLEHTVLNKIPIYYNKSSYFIASSFLLLRAPPAMTLKLMKWTFYGELGIRMSLAIGATMNSPLNLNYQLPIMMRIAAISWITDRVFCFVLNRQPMLNKDLCQSRIFEVSLYDFDSKIKQNQYFSKEDIKDLYISRWLIEYHDIFYNIYLSNKNDVNKKDAFFINAIASFEICLKDLMMLAPIGAQLERNDLNNTMFQILNNIDDVPPLFFMLPDKSNKLGCMVQLWYYTALIYLYSRSADFSYFIKWYHFTNKKTYDINYFKIRSSILSLLVGTCILNIVLLLGNEYSLYFVAYKWYCICNTSMVFARYIIAWNACYPDNKITKIPKVPIDQAKHLLENNLIWLPENAKLSLGAIMFYMQSSCDRWFILRENLNVLVSYLFSHDIVYSP